MEYQWRWEVSAIWEEEIWGDKVIKTAKKR